MATDYYNHKVEEYNKSKWWEAMSTASRLSWSWLSWSAIASSVAWVDTKWEARYNDLLNDHINNLKDLATTYNWFLQWIWNAQNWLWTGEANIMSNLVNTVWQWVQSYANLQNEWVDDIYSPYKTLTWAKVSWATENATTESKAQSKQSEYEACTTPAQRADMLARNLQQVLWEWDYSTKYSELINAVNKYPNDFRKALYAAVDKLWLTEQQKKIVNSYNWDDESTEF
jgi:hypothetical protein